MSNQNLYGLFGLASDLELSASKEGVEEGLMVVGSHELWAVLQEVSRLKKEAEAEPAESEDPAQAVERLAAALKATQAALAQAMQHAETLERVRSATPDSQARESTLKALIEGGMTIGECIRAFAVPEDDPYVQRARSLIAGGDDIEIDDATTTSVGEDGAWVLSWLWVSNDEAGVRPTTEVWSQVHEYAEDALGDAPGATTPSGVPFAVLVDWLDDLVMNFDDILDNIEKQPIKGIPGSISWSLDEQDEKPVRFMASDALNQLRLLARQGGLPDDAANQAEKFCIRYGNKLDAILANEG